MRLLDLNFVLRIIVVQQSRVDGPLVLFVQFVAPGDCQLLPLQVPDSVRQLFYFVERVLLLPHGRVHEQTFLTLHEGWLEGFGSCRQRR